MEKNINMEQTMQEEQVIEVPTGQQEQNRYLVNVVYWFPSQNEQGTIGIETRVGQFGYNKKKEAVEAYDKMKRSGVLLMPTAVGEISFNILSVEHIDIKAFAKLREEEEAKKAELAKQEEDNGESGTTGVTGEGGVEGTEQSGESADTEGVEFDAADQKLNGEQVS